MPKNPLKARANVKIREALEIAGMHQWELADRLKISEATLCRWLRHELPEEEQDMMIQIIKGGYGL